MGLLTAFYAKHDLHEIMFHENKPKSAVCMFLKGRAALSNTSNLLTLIGLQDG